MPRNPTDYRHWKIAVEVEVGRLCGLCTYDLPDYDLPAAFDRGMEVQETARAITTGCPLPMRVAWPSSPVVR